MEWVEGSLSLRREAWGGIAMLNNNRLLGDDRFRERKSTKTREKFFFSSWNFFWSLQQKGVLSWVEHLQYSTAETNNCKPQDWVPNPGCASLPVPTCLVQFQQGSGSWCKRNKHWFAVQFRKIGLSVKRVWIQWRFYWGQMFNIPGLRNGKWKQAICFLTQRSLKTQSSGKLPATEACVWRNQGPLDYSLAEDWF